MLSPAIVVVAYNRPDCLSRLLTSLSKAKYPSGEIPLVISIDYSGTDSTTMVAEAFEWTYGPKVLIKQKERLGLKQHMYACAGLTEKYGSIILLEDDLLAGRAYYDFAAQAVAYYENSPEIAGISLYHYHIAENRFLPFYPLDDGSDVYFLQLPSSWGLALTGKSWKRFVQWKESAQLESIQLPEYIREWSERSWKKEFAAYMWESSTYFVYPRTSLTTNFGEAGEHAKNRGVYQVPFQDITRNYIFSNWNPSAIIYDMWYELLPVCLNKRYTVLDAYDYTIDLYGTKPLESITTKYLLSSKQCNNPIKSYGNELLPVQNNIIYDIKGEMFHLAHTGDFGLNTPASSDFYIQIKAIEVELFEERIHKQAGILLKHSRVHDFYKMFHMVIVGDNRDAIIQTYQSILNTQYPLVTITIIEYTQEPITITKRIYPVQLYHLPETICKGFLLAEILKTESVYTWILNAGDIIVPEALKHTNQLFQEHEHIGWINGLCESRDPYDKNTNSRNLALARFFQIKIKDKRELKHINGTLLMKSYSVNCVLQRIQQIENITFTDVVIKMCELYPLFTTDIVLLKQCIHDTASNYQSVLNPWRHFFLRNTIYLRSFYRLFHKLPPVIRRDPVHGTFYFADY